MYDVLLMPTLPIKATPIPGFHSVRVNSQWRLVFRWDGSRGEAEVVYLDGHSYR
jgi:plasmid maintenance system killer protein